ncbi:hypothetical protein B6U66_02380 [Candidatus Bathyarchaeota archaeon ex4484_135]|nr:MAG: hypothetical protein B6U66_02380 [Candidatus Bathyarchaeota archaeon ex4484_135]
MPHISKVGRYAVENPSAIREIMTIVADFEKHPEKYPRKLIYLAGGWPQDPPPPVLRKALKEIVEDEGAFNLSARYGPTKGEPDLIEAIVRYEEAVWKRPVREGEDAIIAGAGSTELTAAFMLACMDPRDELILTCPGYLNYKRQAEVEGLLTFKVKWWPVVKDHEYEPDPGELSDLITDRTRLVIITTPGNPDSMIMSEDTLEGVLDVAEEKGVWVMVDLAYRAFCFSREPSYFSRPRRENEILMCTFSKELRAPGWRLAYAIADAGLVGAVNAVEQARTLCPSTLVQKIIIRAFSSDENLKDLRAFYDEGRKKYAEVAKMTFEALQEAMPKAVPLEPQGGFYVFFDASAYEPNSKAFCRKLLDGVQVALTPGKDFGMEGWIRLSYAPVVQTPELITEAMERIKEFIGS